MSECNRVNFGLSECNRANFDFLAFLIATGLILAFLAFLSATGFILAFLRAIGLIYGKLIETVSETP